MALGLPWSHVIKYHRWVAALAWPLLFTLADRQAGRRVDQYHGMGGERLASCTSVANVICCRWMGHFTMLAITVHGICYYIIWAFQPGVK